MLTEERYSIILEQVKKTGSVKLWELCACLDASESTIRRDLIALDQKGLLRKVHGGAVAVEEADLHTLEYDVAEKSKLFAEEKLAIARYAASLIEDGDFIFMDAGTTTEKMLDFLPDKEVVFVTNAFVHARKLAQMGFQVLMPAGELKITTEAIVGAECVRSLQGYHFTKSFLGANGISLVGGITTPDRNEASVKRVAVQHSRTAYVLADHSKFDQLAPVTFAGIDEVCILTDKLTNRSYLTKSRTKEVM